MPAFIDLAGQRFRSLVAEKRVHGYNRVFWRCRCDCGKYKDVASTHLRTNVVTNCGCSHGRRGPDHPQFTGYKEIHGQKWTAIQQSGRLRQKRRYLEFSLTIEEAWALFIQQDRKCALSGLPIDFGKRNIDRGTASLDRIDSSKGYTLNNVQWVHKDINLMKNVLPQQYFIDLCRRVAQRAIASL